MKERVHQRNLLFMYGINTKISQNNYSSLVAQILESLNEIRRKVNYSVTKYKT